MPRCKHCSKGSQVPTYFILIMTDSDSVCHLPAHKSVYSSIYTAVIYLFLKIQKASINPLFNTKSRTLTKTSIIQFWSCPIQIPATLKLKNKNNQTNKTSSIVLHLLFPCIYFYLCSVYENSWKINFYFNCA